MCSESVPEFVNTVLFTGDDGIDRAYNFSDQEMRPLFQGNYFSTHHSFFVYELRSKITRIIFIFESGNDVEDFAYEKENLIE